MRTRWLPVYALCAAPALAHAGTLNADAGYCAANPTPSVFSLPAGDPWAVGSAACSPSEGAWTRTGPVRGWRPRRYHPAAAKPKPADTPVVAADRCAMPAQTKTLSMAAGPAVFNVLTEGAKPNSSITLRIDNRTTVTITVNATQANDCGATSYDAALTTDPDSPPKTGGGDLLGAGFLTALNQQPISPYTVIGGATLEQPVTRSTSSAAVVEPSSLLLLGSGALGYRLLTRKRRRGGAPDQSPIV